MLIFSWLPVLTSFFTLGVAEPNARCRCLSTDSSCWPSPRAFATLASQVSQPLLRPVPPESACYPATAPSSNCSIAKASALDGRWRSDQPGAIQAPNWETYTFANGTIEACYLNATITGRCGQGSVPPVGVDARTPEDIQAAVKFAAKYGLRLVVKNTGHDYLGRSTGRGAFLVWTHRMKKITFHDDFTPAGGPRSEKYEAVTLGAGVQWYEAYNAANSTGRVIVGGIATGGSVGAAGGWLQGGGHSVLSPAYGLGVDNVLQITIVTASGAHLTTNAYSHPRLFWALRGGGGGTWGIATSVTYKTYPITPFTGAFILTNATTQAPIRALVAEALRQAPALTDAGFGGYAFLASITNVFQGFYGTPLDPVNANRTMQPLFDYVQGLAGQGLQAQTFLVPFASFHEWYAFIFANRGDTQVGANTEISNRLLSRKVLENSAGDIADVLLDNFDAITWNQVAGGAVNRFDKDSAGLNPAWRSTILEVAGGVDWPDGAPAAYIDELRLQLKQKTRLLAKFSNAAYYNEAMLYEDNFQETFFGNHYDDLKRIKRQYDPTGLFIVSKGVGSEEWEDDLVCRK